MSATTSEARGEPNASAMALAAHAGLPLPRHLTRGRERREIVLVPAAAGSRLLIDRRASDGRDVRLLAHLAAEEPDANAVIVCELYISDSWQGCRRVVASDLVRPPAADLAVAAAPCATEVLVGRGGLRYRLAAIGEPAELRWVRESPLGCDGVPQRVSARHVVGALEDYEPVRSLTRAAIECHRADRHVSIASLRLELRRLETSPIVLNRRLREAVVEAVGRRGLSLSAIAFACGRVKRDQRGRRSGETSWLGRRVGLIPYGGCRAPNPWVHSDVLGLIARDGLGVAPREVELG